MLFDLIAGIIANASETAKNAPNMMAELVVNMPSSDVSVTTAAAAAVSLANAGTTPNAITSMHNITN